MSVICKKVCRTFDKYYVYIIYYIYIHTSYHINNDDNNIISPLKSAVLRNIYLKYYF